MKTIYLFIMTGILSIVLSQVEITSWRDLTSESGLDIPPGTNCEQIGAFDEVNGVIEIFGGTPPNGHYTFNVSSETFITNTVLTEPIVVGTSAAWARSGRFIYYIADESTGVIRQLNIDTLDDTLFATLDGTTNQPQPGICVDESTGQTIIYSVGTQEIETCKPTGLPDGGNICTFTTQSGIASAGDSIEGMACTVYNGSLYTFGGVVATTGLAIQDAYKCDPATQDSCTNIGIHGGPRYGIRVVEMDNCFKGQYVTLIGGIVTTGSTIIFEDATNRVDIYNLIDEEWTAQQDMDTQRVGSVTVWDPDMDQIWVMGGIDAVSTGGCSQEIETSNFPICFTLDPTMDPTIDPTTDPTTEPTTDPTNDPTADPTNDPTADPTADPTSDPTFDPTRDPTTEPTTGAPTTSTTSTTGTTTTTTTTTYEPIEDGYTTSGSAYGVVIGLLIAICCIIVICALWYSKEAAQYGGGYGQAQAPAQVPMVVAAGGGYDSGATGATGYDAPASGGYGAPKPAATGYNGGNSGGGGY